MSSADNLAMKVKLYIQCSNLINLDVLSKTDPLCQVYEMKNNSWQLIGTTEQVHDNLNPKFSTAIPTNYFFERQQRLRFVVSDRDDSNEYEQVGVFECKMAEILNTSGLSKTGKLTCEAKPDRKNGSITVIAEEVKVTVLEDVKLSANDAQALENSHAANTWQEAQAKVQELNMLLAKIPQHCLQLDKALKFNCSATKLDKKDLFGKSDPYFKIYKTMKSGEPIVLFTSSIIKVTLNPVWNDAVLLTLDELAGNDMDRKILVEVWDWDRFKDHDLIGSFEASVNEILKKNKGWPLVNKKKQQTKKHYEHSGLFNFDSFTVNNKETKTDNPEYQKVVAAVKDAESKLQQLQKAENDKHKLHYRSFRNPMTFIDYLSSGLEISLMVCVDYTASNGDPDKTYSLHYQATGKPSQYEQAIVSVGTILADYDHDGNFPLFGFGATKKYGSSQTHHCFPIADTEEVKGVEGLITAYKQSFSKFDLSGPTNFSPCIEQAIQYAKEMEQAYIKSQSLKYMVLLMITDGDISDMEQCVKSIVKASDKPLSIVIVGVGSNSFTSMNELDADEVPLNSGDAHAVRDTVQFVPFRDFVKDPQALAEATLREIPHQVTSYYAMKSIYPVKKQQQQY